MEIQTRDASLGDAPFIAWVQKEASRGHCAQGFFDLAFTSTGPELDQDITALVSAPSLSMWHWSRFLIAEVDGQPGAALSGYEPSKTGDTETFEAFVQAAEARGWAGDFFDTLGERIAPLTDCLLPAPPEVWVVEWVATRPEFRGRGIVARLLQEMLERGRTKGYTTAQISIMIGNDPAQRAYESGGFTVLDENSSVACEEALGTPGFRRMRREI